jgi:hypothetical protein
MGLWFLGSVLLKNLPDKLSIDLVIDNQASAPFRRAVRKTFQRQVEFYSACISLRRYIAISCGRDFVVAGICRGDTNYYVLE